MSGRFVWVVMMWFMAACSLMVGSISAFERLRTSPVDMVLDTTISDYAVESLKQQLEATLNAQGSIIGAPVIYTFKDGRQIPQSDVKLSLYEMQHLLSGETLSVYRNSGKPHAVYSKDELPNPWGWLILGFALLGVSLLASKLFKQELVD